MLINQSDPKNTRGLIGSYLGYHNLLKHLCTRFFVDIKKAPAEMQGDLLKFKTIRDRLAHDLWEILNSDVVALNLGNPEFVITHEELSIEVDSLNQYICFLNMTYFEHTHQK